MPADKTGITPQQKRRDATAHRLRAALARLLAREGNAKLSVANLAREAGIGRNAIYVNHRDVIAELLQAASSRVDAAAAPKEAPETDWRAVAIELREQVRGLATENARLLKCAQDAELATARVERRAAKLDAELRALRSPVHLHGTKPNARNR
ncbi:TetR family transcriptional regulator [Bradyrhizobium sp. CCGUVB1N3]|uniref:TetR family transcriptional regulator n=1 Tax=Bradyrhizobium sp. CCGUVB1N3 TaxID=2949629 RepID=UPI0020B25F8A|nr:TetR family transcriptional regulator [Bradyrhizobium sp. CCGUVB1N3]MCP3475553.1 TetR family transcriptional regulator [Bradyrhizobium sp. CCGUVB1N3]MCP3476429.1 TetR family transcriptional regulator [Bradyrhizobium sp. CCGUVB1N3]